MNKKSKKIILNITGILILLFLSFLIPAVSYEYGKEADWHALSLGNFLLKEWKRGNVMPVYDLSSLNGYDPFIRNSYLSSALLAGLEGTGIPAETVFSLAMTAGLLIGSAGWLYAGIRKQRRAYGTAAGAVWIFSVSLLFAGTSDLAGFFSLSFLPWMLFFLHENREKRKGAAGILIVWLVMSAFSPAVSLMILGAMGIEIVLFGFLNRKGKEEIRLLGYLVLIFMATACRMISFLKSGSFFRSTVSFSNALNPFQGEGYYGIGMILAALTGLCGGNRKTIPGFLSALVVFVLVLFPVAVPVENVVQTASCISLAFVLISFLEWNQARKEVSMAVCLLLCMDLILPREQAVYNVLAGKQIQTSAVSDALVKKVGNITTQRLLVIDGDQKDSDLHWTLRNTAETDGDDVSQSGLKNQMALMNTAVNDGAYGYLFTRAKLYGDDTVLIAKSQIHEYRIHQNDSETIIRNARQSGYEPAGENSRWILFHFDRNGTWGTVTKWNAIAIGTDANTIALAFEDTEETSDPDINHYTFRKLSSYQTVYLSGFTYTDRKAAEDLVLRLSRAGIRVVIAADGIPYSRETRMKEFLGVSCNAISFENGYPLLETEKNGTLDTDLFPIGYRNWHTYYLNGLDHVYGKIRDHDVSLAFWGTEDNENLVFLGLNLPYYYQLTEDASVGKIFDAVWKTEKGQLPDMKTVDLKMTQGNRRIEIQSEQDGVCTSLTDLSSFHSDRQTENLNGLLVVNKGTSVIRIHREKEIPDFLISAGFLILSVIVIIRSRRKQSKTEKKS